MQYHEYQSGYAEVFYDQCFVVTVFALLVLLKLLTNVFHNGLMRLISNITDIKNSNITNS